MLVFGAFGAAIAGPLWASPENLIGGATVSITPIKQTNDGYVIVRVTIHNVTSVGSGNPTNGQSFPRPINSRTAQPYTNISQVIEIDVKIKIGQIK